MLKARGYRSDPVKTWKASLEEKGGVGPEEGEEGEEDCKEGEDYNYLLSMQMVSLTIEKKNQLLKNRDDKVLP